jgi:LPS sulfotransferase NodH
LLAPRRRFVILTSGRAGSELLISLLDSHPEIACDGEILQLRRVAPWALIESRAALAGLGRARAYGFKLLRSHLLVQGRADPAEQLLELHRRGFALITLERRDMLQQAISHLISPRVGYHHRRGEEPPFERQRVDPMAVIAMLVALEDLNTFAREALAGVERLSLVYEDDLIDPERQRRAVARICERLAIEPRPVSSELVKVTPSRTRELLSNYEELERALAGTRFAHHLEGSSPRARLA